MSYTLRGRVETRLVALVPVLVAACTIAGARHRWWPVELVALMAAVGVSLDFNAWHRLLPYQPAWATIPVGAVELGLLMAIAYGFGLHAPLVPTLALFGAGWLASVVLGQAGFPLLRLGYAEDGGELGRTGAVAAGVVLLAFVGSGATWFARLPPVVHLSAGVHQGPIVIRHREILQGEPGAVVRGGIVVAHDNVQIRDVTVLGGGNGITVDMLGNRLGQGIDVSFNMELGMSLVEGCTVVGGQQGITTHSSATDIMGNRVSRTTGEAISVDEMSMGMAAHNTVRDALGVGLYCNDRSMCMFEHNTVVGTRDDSAGGNRSRRGFGVLSSFLSEADLRGNEIASNPVPYGAVTNAQIATAH